jgi:DNA mismatch endonuclease (patch repair protein)
MRANRRADTQPELALRSLLHRHGYRFRKDYRIRVGTLSVRPDVVFSRPKVCVFVDGCFWHRCPEHGTTPKANASYWIPKLAANVERDEAVSTALTEAGWRVIRIWEHVPPDAAAGLVMQAVAAASAC